MKAKDLFNKMREDFQNDFNFRFEKLILEVTENICKVLHLKEIKKKKLAEKLSSSPAAVSKLLDGNSNFTLKTLLSIADALEQKIQIEFVEPVTTVYIDTWKPCNINTWRPCSPTANINKFIDVVNSDSVDNLSYNAYKRKNEFTGVVNSDSVDNLSYNVYKRENEPSIIPEVV